jgi:hypothetical protein
MSTLPCSRAGPPPRGRPAGPPALPGSRAGPGPGRTAGPRSSLSGKSKEASWMVGRRGSSAPAAPGPGRSRRPAGRGTRSRPAASGGPTRGYVAQPCSPVAEVLAQVTLVSWNRRPGGRRSRSASRRGQPAPAGLARGASAGDRRGGAAAAADPEPQRPDLADRGRRHAAAVGRARVQPAHGRAGAGVRPRGGRLGRRACGPTLLTDVMQTVHASARAGRSGSCSGRRWRPWSSCAASGTCSCSSGPPWP